MPRKNKADYSVDVIRGIIVITDLDLGGRSVTNDAEGVIKDLVESGGFKLDTTPVIYRDSTGHYDQLKVVDDKFAGFGPLNTDRLLDALAKVRPN